MFNWDFSSRLSKEEENEEEEEEGETPIIKIY